MRCDEVTPQDEWWGYLLHEASAEDRLHFAWEQYGTACALCREIIGSEPHAVDACGLTHVRCYDEEAAALRDRALSSEPAADLCIPTDGRPVQYQCKPVTDERRAELAVRERAHVNRVGPSKASVLTNRQATKMH